LLFRAERAVTDGDCGLISASRVGSENASINPIKDLLHDLEIQVMKAARVDGAVDLHLFAPFVSLWPSSHSHNI
jgi:hypothetical protein